MFTLSTNVELVFTKNKEDITSKIVKARQLNVPCFTETEFTEKYLQ